jgi:hypothetical protein
VSPNDDQIHDAACRAGATRMGSEDAPQHYIMNADELRRFVAFLLPPCPVPLPQK